MSIFKTTSNLVLKLVFDFFFEELFNLCFGLATFASVRPRLGVSSGHHEVFF